MACFSMTEFATIGVSSIHGDGLFAKVDIPKGMILIDEEIDGRSLSTYMNDNDFIYPISYNKEHLLSSFQKYINNDKCNLLWIDDDVFKTQIEIKKGEELTKRYGLQRWIEWILLDIYGRNPLGIYCKRENVKEVTSNMENLFLTIGLFGYTIKYNEGVEKSSHTVFEYLLKTFEVIPLI